MQHRLEIIGLIGLTGAATQIVIVGLAYLLGVDLPADKTTLEGLLDMFTDVFGISWVGATWFLVMSGYLTRRDAQ